MKTLTIEEIIAIPSVRKSIEYHAKGVDLADRQDIIQEFYVALTLAHKDIQKAASVEALCNTIIKRKKFAYYRSKQFGARANETLLYSSENSEGEENETTMDSYSKEDVSYEFVEFQQAYTQVRDKFFEGEKAILDLVIIDRTFDITAHGELSNIAAHLGFTKAYVSRTIKKLKIALS